LRTGKAAKDGSGEELDARLRAGWLGFARAEQSIARYLLDNMDEVPFETGAVIAAAAGVSEASVARFVRRLGFADLKELKRDLRRRNRTNGAALDNAEARFRIGGAERERLARSLRMEQEAIAAAYELAHGKAWDRIVSLLANSEHVNCVGFQAVKGLALDFSTRLRWVRGGVRFAEGVGGTFSEILTENPRRSCVVIVDTAEYAAMTFSLAAEIKQRRIPLIVVTDRYSHWAQDFTDLALEVSTRVDLYWDSTSPISAVLTLLTHAVAEKLGSKAEKRMEELESIAANLRTFRQIPKRSGALRESRRDR
jgi:DNA-binding MurR/RpiR family transcriptional regulator